MQRLPLYGARRFYVLRLFLWIGHAGERKVWKCVSVLKGQNTQERKKSGSACRFRRGRARKRKKSAEVRVGLEGAEHAGEREERKCVSV